MATNQVPEAYARAYLGIETAQAISSTCCQNLWILRFLGNIFEHNHFMKLQRIEGISMYKFHIVLQNIFRKRRNYRNYKASLLIMT